MILFCTLLNSSKYCNAISMILFCALLNSSKYCYAIPIILFCVLLNSSKYFYAITMILSCMLLNSSKYCYVIPMIFILHTVKRFIVLRCTTNNSVIQFFYTQLCGQTVLFDLQMGPYQGLLLWFRVDLVTMAIKVYSTFPKRTRAETSP